MLAGSGAILQEQFGLSYEAGVLILSGLTFLTFLTGAKGMVSVNSFLAPVLTAGILFISMMGILQPQKTAQANSYLQLVPVVYAIDSPGGELWEGSSLIPFIRFVQYVDRSSRSHNLGSLFNPRENAVSRSGSPAVERWPWCLLYWGLQHS